MYRNQADELAELVRAHAIESKHRLLAEAGPEAAEAFWDYLEEIIKCELYNTDDLDFSGIDPEDMDFFKEEDQEYIELFTEMGWLDADDELDNASVGVAVHLFYEAILGTKIAWWERDMKPEQHGYSESDILYEGEYVIKYGKPTVDPSKKNIIIPFEVVEAIGGKAGRWI
jgi:hypothetical protein